MAAAYRCSCVLSLLVVSTVCLNAKAVLRDDNPTMEVQVTRTIFDYWPDRPGLETRWTITVTNVSRVAEQNNMIQFVYPAGDVVNGVFYVNPETG